MSDIGDAVGSSITISNGCAVLESTGNLSVRKITATAPSAAEVAGTSAAVAGATADIHQFTCGGAAMVTISAAGMLSAKRVVATAPSAASVAAESAGAAGATADIHQFTCGGAVMAAISAAGAVKTFKIKGNSGVPTVTVGSVGWYMGVAGTFTANSNDISGEFVFTPGTTASGSLFTVNFNKTYSTIPFVNITPSFINSASINIYVTATTTGFTVYAANAVSTGVTYKFMYSVMS